MKTKTDPYGKLEWAIGSADDFVCFDYAINRRRKVVTIGSCLNSETGHFIQDFRPEFEVSYKDDLLAPYNAAIRLMWEAADWAVENGVVCDVKGWNQEGDYFARCVHAAVTRSKETVLRFKMKMVRRPIITSNYL